MLQSILAHKALTCGLAEPVDAPLVLAAGSSIHWGALLGLAQLRVVLTHIGQYI